jgi:hypothetical protein
VVNDDADPDTLGGQMEDKIPVTPVPRSVARVGHIDEWHVDLEKIVTMEKLGGYSACPD